MARISNDHGASPVPQSPRPVVGRSNPNLGAVGTPPSTLAGPALPALLRDGGQAPIVKPKLHDLSLRVGAVQSADIASSKAQAQLERLDQLLAELGSAVDEARRGPADEARVSLQEKLDSIARTITIASEQAGKQLDAALASIGPGFVPGVESLELPVDGSTPSLAPGALVFSNLDARVEQFNARAALEPGQSVDVEIAVTASAQLAGFYLSFGDRALNLGGLGADDGVFERFVFEIGGVKGSQILSFASGTTITDVAEAINSFTDLTGTRAVLSGSEDGASGIRLVSEELGSSQFVSVRIIGDGVINQGAANAGIYELQDFNSNAAKRSVDPDDRTLFSAANLGRARRDAGRDVAGLINGEAFVGRGRSVTFDGLGLDAKFRLSEAASQRLQSGFRAATITAPGAAALTEGDAPLAAQPPRADLEGLARSASLAAGLALNDPEAARAELERSRTLLEPGVRGVESFRREALAAAMDALKKDLGALGEAPAPPRPLTAERAAALLGLKPK